MQKEAINFDDIPEYINKDQLYRICHISKSTALFLLKSGKIPCEDSGKKTRRYRIKKEDVIRYLKERKIFPESYSAPAGWYKGNYEIRMQEEMPPLVLEDMQNFFSKYLENYPDVLTVNAVGKLISYQKSTINGWCMNGYLKSFKKNNIYYIPKLYLVEFICSVKFRTITRKSEWHIYILGEFSKWEKSKQTECDSDNRDTMAK